MTPKTERFEMRFDPVLLDRVDEWCGTQSDFPSRAEAIRRLIEAGVTERPKEKFRPTHAERLIIWLLTELLGPRPAVGSAWSGSATPPRPARLAELATQIAAAFGTRRPVNPDSPSQVLRALAADGVRLPSTRLAVLKDADHPVIAPLIEYKELARLHSAFGWSWLDTWVAGGRFRPE